MSQKTFTSSIFVKLGQTQQNEEHLVKTVELDFDPVTKTITKDRKTSRESKKTEIPPEFIIKPRRQFVNEDQSAKFKASHDGSSSTVLTWSKDGTVLHSSRKNKIYTDGVLHILEVKKVSTEDGGVYTCTICNSGGTAETTAELEVYSEYSKPQKSQKKVYAAPSVDIPLQDITVLHGDKNIVLECKFSNAVDSIVCWYKNGQPLHKSLFTRQNFDGRLSKLILTTITESHGGLYECAAANTGGEVRSCCRVAVMAPGTRSIPPKFVNPLSDQTLCVGDNLLLEAKVTGYPRPSIKWYKNQQEIKTSRVLRTEFDGSTVRLIMENVDLSDSDSYKCIAENDVGIDQIKAKVTVQREVIRKTDNGTDVVQHSYTQPVSPVNQGPVSPVNQGPVSPVNQRSALKPESATKLSSHIRSQDISVRSTTRSGVEKQPALPSRETSRELPSRETSREPPTFVQELQDSRVKTGDPVELLVEVKGSPPVEIVWVHNNSEVNEDHPVYRTTCSDNIHQLVIPRCKPEDAGEFVCEAYNEYGEIDTFCRLSVSENLSDMETIDENKEALPQVYHAMARKIQIEDSNDSDRGTPPDFVLKPRSAMVEKEKSAIFLCRPEGNPRPSVQWLKQGIVIENSDKYKVTHGDDSILEIRNVVIEDCGKYTCLLLNPSGSVSTDIELTMGKPNTEFKDTETSAVRKRSIPDSPKRSTLDSPKRTPESPKRSALDSPKHLTPDSPKRFTPEGSKRGVINRKIEMFDKPQDNSPSSNKLIPARKLPTTFSSNLSRGRQGHSHQTKEDFRDVLNKIKTPKDNKLEHGLASVRNKGLSTSRVDSHSVVSQRQRDKSPVKVSDAVRKFSKESPSTDQSMFVSSRNNRNLNSSTTQSPKSISGARSSRINVRKLANDLSGSPQSLKMSEIENETPQSKTICENKPKVFNRCENEETESKTEFSVKERQAVIHSDLKTIIGKKQTMILQEQQIEGMKVNSAKTLPSPTSEGYTKTLPSPTFEGHKTLPSPISESHIKTLPSPFSEGHTKTLPSPTFEGHIKTLPSPTSEGRMKRNFLAEATQNSAVEMGAVFGQKFEADKIRTMPEKQKRTSVVETPVTGQVEFKILLEKKRNSLPATSSPTKLHSTGSFREKMSGQKESDPSPIIKTSVKRINNVDEVLDRLKDRPPKPEQKIVSSFTQSVPKSAERMNRSRNLGETRRLSRESSPNFRNVLNQIEAKTKIQESLPQLKRNDQNTHYHDIKDKTVLTNRKPKVESSPKITRSALPQKNSVEFSPSNYHHAKIVNNLESNNGISESSDSSEKSDHQVVETKLEMQKSERAQKWNALSELYAEQADDQISIQGNNMHQNGRIENTQNHNGGSLDKYERKISSVSYNNHSSPNNDPHREMDRKNVSHREVDRENVFENMNGSNSESDVHESASENIPENLGPGHAVMMNLKRTKFSEVEELFEDFSRIDREFESLKRNPRYGPIEKLDVDDEDKKILRKISGLSSDLADDVTSSPSDDIRSVPSKKQTKYSKKFDFEKSPAIVEQLDFRHVLKRHVEPHHRQYPKFLADLVDVRVREGQSVTLQCQVSGIPRPDVAWAMNNKRIKPSKFFRMTYEDNTSTLVIAGAYPEDDGEYVCSATNSLGTARCSCHLYVEECGSNPSNEVTDEEGPSDLSSNQTSTFSSHTPVRKISYSSTETPPFTPSFEQQPITVSQQYEHKTPSMPSVSTSLDESNYDEFEDDFESVQKQAPHIHEISPRNVVTERGQKLQLQVSFTAEPKPVVRWFRDSFEIISNKLYSINTTEHFSRLIIDQVDGGDSGKYYVTVDNDVGSDSIDTTVTVLDVPSPPSKPYATETTLFTVILSWSEPDSDGGSLVKTYKVEMCNAEEEEWQTLSENCSSTSFCATNLAGHNPFFFRVSAKNKIGLSEPSPVSDVIVTKDNHPSHRLSVDSDDVFGTTGTYIDNDSPISPFLPRAMQEEELPFTPRTVVPATEKVFEDHYDKIAEVGKGKFGNVYKCLHKTEKETWAAKVIKCRKKDEKFNVKNEISIMNELTHPKLLMLRDAYETPKSMVLVMEYVGGGELFDRVADEDLELTERDCVHFMRQICEGVRYMHEKSIMHLDLKPENILCVRKDSNLIKIIDFGLARRFTPGESLKVMFGTPEFIAPEVVNYEQIGLQTDIWSLGVICYVLLSGLSPFMGDSDGETLSNVTQGDFDFDDEAFEEISEEARHFIEKCLLKNMKKRITISECIEHKWLAHSERNSSKKLRQSLRNLKQFMARRKWQKMGTAIRAIGRMSIWQKQRGDSKSIDHSSITSDSDIASQSDLSVLPVSRSTSRGETDFKGENLESSDTTETDEEVFNQSKDEDEDCEDDKCVNCENNNKHIKTMSSGDTSAPAEIIKDMVDCEAVKGDVVRFDIAVEGHPTPHVEWLHDSSVIKEDSRHSFIQSHNGLHSLIIRDICESDEGDYTCKVVNDNGEDTCSAELIVYGVNAF
ncbi:myosin light chain kinase, smooth muscle-like isoform X2 [Mytilus trossulus]|uniref:myosin light chain kinase, smooth muscle-like isoform X2 n=1 Tax=Mytilus trossulus TaxID=6551 RepID=UPI003006DF30